MQMSDSNSIQIFHMNCFEISIRNFINIMSILVLEFYSILFSFKQFISLAVQYEDRRYFSKLPAKSEFLFCLGAVCKYQGRPPLCWNCQKNPTFPQNKKFSVGR